MTRVAIALLLVSTAIQVPSGQVPDFVPVADRALENPAPDDWLSWRRTLNGWGYSPLDQITRQNVGQLRLVWMRGMAPGIQEATPLVYRGTMFLPNPADVLQAINAATGDLLWEYRRPVPADLQKFLLGSPLKNRNLAIYDDKIIDLSVDDYVYAVDARTGQPAWNTQIQDYRTLPAGQTSGRSPRGAKSSQAARASSASPARRA